MNYYDEKFTAEMYSKELCLKALKNKEDFYLEKFKTKKLLIDFPAIFTLESYNITKLISLRDYLQDYLLENQNSEQFNTFKIQLSIINSILKVKPKSYYYFEDNLFHRYMAYNYIYSKPVGRIYSLEKSIPQMKKEIRSYLFDNLYVDVDLINSHPSLLLNFLYSEGFTLEILKSEFYNLYTLVTNRDLFYNEIAKELKSHDDIKKKVLIVMNSIKIPFYLKQSKLLKAFFSEIHKIREYLISKKNFNSPIIKDVYEAVDFSKKPKQKIPVSIQSFLCQSLESQYLKFLHEFLIKKITNKNFSDLKKQTLHFIPFFDGAYIKYSCSITQSKIKNFIEEFNEKYLFVKFKIKPIKQEYIILDKEKLEKYENITYFLNKIGVTKCQNIFFINNLEIPKLLDEEILKKIKIISNKQQEINKKITQEIDELYRRKKNLQSRLTRREAKIKKINLNPNFIEQTSALNEEINNILIEKTDLIESIKKKSIERKATYKIVFSEEIKKLIVERRNKIFYDFRNILLEDADSAENLLNKYNINVSAKQDNWEEKNKIYKLFTELL